MSLGPKLALVGTIATTHISYHPSPTVRGTVSTASLVGLAQNTSLLWLKATIVALRCPLDVQRPYLSRKWDFDSERVWSLHWYIREANPLPPTVIQDGVIANIWS